MLPRPHRLSAQRDVKRVSSCGRPVFSSNFTIRCAPNRIGRLRATVVAGLKVSKRSTVRNRVKRLIREAIQRNLVSIRADADLVVYAKPAAVGKSYQQLAEELGRALSRAHILRGPWGDK
jgi:ribonuclease P protein component